MVTNPAGLGTKNDCACEDQQQFTRPDHQGGFQNMSLNKEIWSWVWMGTETKYGYGEGQQQNTALLTAHPGSLQQWNAK
jgi:hypothetical protein